MLNCKLSPISDIPVLVMSYPSHPSALALAVLSQERPAAPSGAALAKAAAMQIAYRSWLRVPALSLLLLSAGLACQSTALHPDGGAKVDAAIAGLGGTTITSQAGQTGGDGTGAAGSSGGKGGSAGFMSSNGSSTSITPICNVDCWLSQNYRCSSQTTYRGRGVLPAPSQCSTCTGHLTPCSGTICEDTTGDLSCPEGTRCAERAGADIKDACQPIGTTGTPDGGIATGGAGQTGSGGTGAAGSSGGKGGSTGSVSSGSSSLPLCAVDCFLLPTYRCTSDSTYRGYGPVAVPALCTYCGGSPSRCSGKICQYTTDEISCPAGTRCVPNPDAGIQGACQPVSDAGMDGKDAPAADTGNADR